MDQLLRQLLQICSLSGILPTFTLSDTVGNAEVQKATLSHTESSLLVGTNCFERTQSIRPLANGNAANGWILRAGWRETVTSGSLRTWGWNSPALLDSLPRGAILECTVVIRAPFSQLFLMVSWSHKFKIPLANTPEIKYFHSISQAEISVDWMWNNFLLETKNVILNFPATFFVFK